MKKNLIKLFIFLACFSTSIYFLQAKPEHPVSSPSENEKAKTPPNPTPSEQHPQSNDKAYTVEKLSPPPFEFVINIPSTQLLVFQNGQLVQSHFISVGAPAHPTPNIKLEISSIEWNPWWYPPDSPWAKGAKVTPPGKGNPLGPVKMLMQNNDIRIHGTNTPSSIGHAASHGCLRMKNDEVKEMVKYIQEETFGDVDPKIYENYAKQATKTVKKVFPEDKRVWAYIMYEPIVKQCDDIVIYPNFYNKKMDYLDKIHSILNKEGSFDLKFDEKSLKKALSKKKSVAYLSISKLKQGLNLNEALSYESTQACGEDSQWVQLLEKARDRYNVLLKPVLPTSAVSSTQP